MLAFDVRLPHVDDTLQPEQRTDRSHSHSVLACACLGDDAALAHALGQQGLPDGIVYLVCSGVVEVFPFEVDFAAVAF